MAGIEDIDTKPPLTPAKVIAVLESTAALEANYVRQIALLKELRESTLVHWAGDGAKREAACLRHEARMSPGSMATRKLAHLMKKLEARVRAMAENAG